MTAPDDTASGRSPGGNVGPATELAERVARTAQADGRTIACAESVTAGAVAQRLAEAPEASDWFSGSVVAYRTATKRDLLGVRAERIISAECASELAAGASRLFGADVAVGITGVGGPDPEEDRPAGTVFIAVSDDGGRAEVFEHRFDGEPHEVVAQATAHALRHLHDAVAAGK
jgi:PncC family amidohydrolase